MGFLAAQPVAATAAPAMIMRAPVDKFVTSLLGKSVTSMLD